MYEEPHAEQLSLQLLLDDASAKIAETEESLARLQKAMEKLAENLNAIEQRRNSRYFHVPK